MNHSRSCVAAAWLVLFCLGAVSADDASLDALIDALAREVPKDRLGKTGSIVDKIAKLKDPTAIPKLIGIIDSDNSYKTIYFVGKLGLGPLTGVDYDELHHGPWWKKWWAENKKRFPKEVQDIPIPTFPLTQSGREFAAKPPNPDSIILEPTADDYLARVKTILETGDKRELSTACERLVKLRDERVIPKLIGLMDADNSPLAVEPIGLALSSMTEVHYHPSRHGAWWRAWWEANNGSFPQSVQEVAIPDYPKTEHGKQFAKRIEGQPVILNPTLDDLLKLLTDEIAADPESSWIGETADWIASYENPRAIEPLITLLAQDEKQKRAIGSALRKLTGVRYDEPPDGRWWTSWWDENKGEINRRIDPAAEPPSGNLYLPSHRRKLPEGEDVRDVPATDTLIGGDERKRYVLIGPKKDAQRPATGWRLLLIMPGGDGSPDFHPFAKRICKVVLSGDYLAAQVIAPEWHRSRKIVWPTKTQPWKRMQFSTEELIEAVIDDIRSKHQIDDRFVFTLSWSSSGPAAYAISLQETTRVTGSFVAMSVFQPETLPPLSRAKDQRYFILHSPQDWIPIKMAEEAERLLKENGAAVQFQTYQGGHGWRDDPYGKMRTAIEWLESHVMND